jgi:hypothetical protein
MSKIKVLIHVDGGNIQLVASNIEDIDIVIVDIDNQDCGGDPVTLYNHSVIALNDFRELYPFTDSPDKEIQDRLKDVKFANNDPELNIAN